MEWDRENPRDVLSEEPLGGLAEEGCRTSLETKRCIGHIVVQWACKRLRPARPEGDPSGPLPAGRYGSDHGTAAIAGKVAGMALLYYSHETFAEHDTGAWHPERPERLAG